jgi:hypothetical protein
MVRVAALVADFWGLVYGVDRRHQEVSNSDEDVDQDLNSIRTLGDFNLSGLLQNSEGTQYVIGKSFVPDKPRCKPHGSC